MVRPEGGAPVDQSQCVAVKEQGEYGVRLWIGRPYIRIRSAPKPVMKLSSFAHNYTIASHCSLLDMSEVGGKSREREVEPRSFLSMKHRFFDLGIDENSHA